MLSLALKNLMRRPLRALLTAIGLAVSVGLLACLLSFGEGYQRSLHRELDGMGMQLMLVPLGCPYDAAAQVLKGRALDVTLPASALDTARHDPAVAVAAPVYAATLPRPDLGRTDLWVGVDESTRQMRPWWRLTPGSSFFTGPDSILLGAEAAMTELRKPGDKLYSPETGRTLTVCGVLERSGTSDDSQFFVPLATAQAMFHQPGKLTAVMIRLKDPASLAEASDRLQQVKGAQVVTLTEMMGTFLNLMGAARSLILAVAVVALCISALSVFNTMMAATLERTRELGVLRAVGFSRGAIFGLMALESLLLAVVGGLAGLLLASLAGRGIDQAVRPYVPLAPEGGLPLLTAPAVAECLLLMFGVGALAGAYPAWQASRLRPAVALDME
jgi:putative ABC transport system permease protein